MSRYDVRDKVALVTGGARGIGLATCQALQARGAQVVLCDLDQAAAELAASQVSPQAVGLAADVTDRAAMQRVVATAVERFGGLDIVVANAGIASRGATMRAMATEAFDRVLDVDTWGVVRTVEASLPEITRRGGHVVVIGSIYSFMNGMGVIPYAMSKAAVEQLGRGLRVELAQHGAGASVAYFGFIDTEMVRRGIDADPVADQLFEALPKPLHKRLKPSEAGEAIARGIERRQPRIIRPRRWAVLSTFRGILNPLLDRAVVRDARIQGVLRELDSREGQEQPTTA